MRSMRCVTLLFLLAPALVVSGCTTGSGTDMERASEINTQLGMSYLQRGDLNEANDSFEKALEQNRRNPDAHAGIAVLYERLGEYDNADHHFSRSVRLDDDNPSVRNNYGRFLCNQERYSEAENQFRAAWENALYDRREVALSNAGMCALRAGDKESAEVFLQWALEENDQFAPALRRMAELRFEAGDPVSARGYYQRFTDVGRQGPESLWLGIRIEDELDNQDEVASYALLLRNQYPDSEEARKLREMREQ